MILAILTLAFGSALDDLDSRVRFLEERRAELSEAVDTRGGFDSGARELEIYEAALYELLVGDPYQAAMGFHVLVNMGSDNEALLQDAEWYLAEALLKLGFVELAATRFKAMASSGHPMRDNALIALVRLRAEHGPATAFTEVYEQALAASRVSATPEFTYILGRAQYDLNDFAEARRVLQEVPAASSHALRARYLLGVIDLREDELEQARVQFEGISALTGTLTAEELARDLAVLAVARIHFHRKEYDDASDWYGRLASLETVLDESLSENIWNQVALEDWGATLLAFGYFHHIRPGHRDAGRMRVLEGHVLYKMGRHAEAEVAYNRVRDLFSSIIERMELLDMQSPETVALLRDLSGWEAGKGLPPQWALVDFLDEDGVNVALALQADTHWLEEELASSLELVREISDAMSTNGAIGRFQIYRQEADSQLDGLLQIRLRLLIEEARNLVLAGAISKKRGDALEVRLERELDRLIDVAYARSERFTRVGEMRADRRGLKQQLEIQEVPATRLQLRAVEAELGDLENLRRLPPYDGVVRGRLEGLRAEIRGLRNTAYTAAVPDLLHAELDLQITETEVLRARVDSEEASARIPIEATLHTEATRLAAIRDELTGTSTRVAAAWSRQSDAAVAAVREQVSDGLMQAEAGLGDVVWLKLLDTRDRIDAVQENQRLANTELDDLFRTLRDRGQ